MSTNQYGPWRFYHRCPLGVITGVSRDVTQAGTGLAIDLAHSHPIMANLLRVLVTDTTIHSRMMSPAGFTTHLPPEGWKYGLYLALMQPEGSEMVVLAPENSEVWKHYLETMEPVDRDEEFR